MKSGWKNCNCLIKTSTIVLEVSLTKMKKFLLTNDITAEVLPKDLPFDISIAKRIGPISILVEDPDAFYESESFLSYTDGYVRDLGLRINATENTTGPLIERVFQKWPVPGNISGSFSSTILDKSKMEVVICNDPFGLYPLYYLIIAEKYFISNSITLMGIASGVALDEAGIVQRCLGPEYANLGKRTILEGCNRLLPGEWLKLNTIGDIVEVKYDNSLYQEISGPAYDENSLHDYWEILKLEISHCLNQYPKVNLALSGGIDSRIILGGIPKEKKLVCHTFGGVKNYETKIAARLATLKGAEFQSYEDLDLYFPNFEVLKKYTKETEALYLGSWLEILERVSGDSREPFITGDLTTALTGRNISRFASQKYKKDNFFRSSIQNRDYVFTPSTPENFKRWKQKIRESYFRQYSPRLLDKIEIILKESEIKEALSENLEELFQRIEAHGLPYVELYDELFMWYTHTRTKSAKQVLICANRFKSFAPAMSVQVLRKASNIHPNQRLNFRFINKMLRKIPELKYLSKIPTSQVPLIPASSPGYIKFPVWGLRSAADNFLIKRVLKSKDPNRRYRLFRSINWVRVYQNPKMTEHLDQYFSINNLGKALAEEIKDQCISRQKMDQWPLANMEVLSIASLNAELDLIEKYMFRYEV